MIIKKDNGVKLKLSIIIPVYNEEKTIVDIIKKVKDVNLDTTRKEIIVVDDGSDDKTVSVLKNKIEPIVDKVIYKQKNIGKGAAIRTGIEYASGDYIIFQDADLEYDPEEYVKLLKLVIEEKADVVYG